MKRSILVLAFAFIGLVYFSSCKKCSTCTAKDASGNVVKTSDEFCEKNKEELEKQESAFKTDNAVNGNTVTCEDK